MLSAGDNVAVAGGRAVNRTAHLVRRLSPERKRISVTPLSGRMWAGHWQWKADATFERPLDPDDNAFVLASAFEQQPGTKFSQIGNALYSASEREAEQAIQMFAAFLPNGEWKPGLGPPTRAIVGVGVFSKDSGHRLLELLERYASKGSEQQSSYAVFLRHVAQ